MSAKRPDVYVERALQALDLIPQFLANRSQDAYLADAQCRAAVERQLEIAGDCLAQLRRIDANVFERIPEGALIIAFRNILAHGYASLDHRRVFATAMNDVPGLREVLTRLLGEFPEEGG